MSYISNIFLWLRNFSGSAILLCVGIAILLFLVEAALYSRKNTKNDIRRIAVITGASSGLGELFARRIDEKYSNIDEIWLIARRKDRLDEVAKSLHKSVKVLKLDLTSDTAIQDLKDALTDNSVRVGLFVNAAGFGKIGNYEKISETDQLNMIDLNCRAAVATTLAVLPYMQAGDHIIEICSTAAFQPLQHMNIYAASKSFLYNYTRALRLELLPRKIVVTAVCPWWIKDTEFIGVARDGNSASAAAIKGFPLSARKEKIVRRALLASRIGLAVVTPDVMSFFHRIFAKILPRKFMLYFWEVFRRL